MWRRGVHTKFNLENFTGKDHLEDIKVDVRKVFNVYLIGIVSEDVDWLQLVQDMNQ
jgi:hypothetical protein